MRSSTEVPTGSIPVSDRLIGLPYLPVTHSFPHLGPAGLLLCLPAKFRLRFLPAIDTAKYPKDSWRDEQAIAALAAQVKDAIQRELDSVTLSRRSVWV